MPLTLIQLQGNEQHAEHIFQTPIYQELIFSRGTYSFVTGQTFYHTLDFVSTGE